MGYKPNNAERLRQMKQKKEKRMVKLGWPEIEESMNIPSLCETFRSVGLIHSDLVPTLGSAIKGLFIHMVKEEKIEKGGASSSILPCPPGYELKN